MEKRYGALRLFGLLYKILGIIILVLAVLTAAGTCIMGFVGGAAAQELSRNIGSDVSIGLVGLITAFITLFGGAISGLSLYAIGEGIFLLINIEENTRASATLLRQQNNP